MRRSILLTLIALLSVLYAQAYGFQSGDLYYNITSRTEPFTVEVTYQKRWPEDNYKGLTAVTIPATIIYSGTTYNVTSIGSSAFSNCTGLASITIPESVTSIGNGAFSGCTSLTSITIPNSVTSIGYAAFKSCTGLTSITIPNNVTNIGDDAFRYCTALTSITIPNSVTSIGNWAFDGCTGLTSVTIPDSVTSIGWSAFSNCTGLTSVTIPNSVTSIEGWAFDGCTGLTSITIPNSVTSIGGYAFSNCTGLTSITIPNSVTSIGMGAFAACIGITSIVVESGNTVYDNRENCNAIIETATNALIQGCNTTIIPNNITSIGGYAFAGCTGLTSVTIPNNVTSIGNCAFWYCTGLTSVVWNAKKCGWNRRSDSPFYSIKDTITSFTFGNEVDSIPAYLCTGMCKLTAITIPNSVTSIGSYAFYGCTGLTSITIPNSVTSIGDGAFSRCTGLTSIVWNAKYCSGWSNYYDSPFYNIRNNITSFSFGDEVDTIPYAICDNMQNLRSITIPESVTHIGGSAFYGCSSLTSVTIPNRVTSMGNYAFRNCTGLTSIQVEAQTPPQCFESSFYDIPEDIPVYISCGTKEAYQAADGWSAFTNIIEEHDYAATILSSNEDYGTATIIAYACDNELTIQATANQHYHFTQWNDGNTDNPRTFMVSQDTTLQAEFALNHYTVTTICEISQGIVTGGGTYQYGEQITLQAVPNSGYEFKQWSNGLTYNPYRFTVIEDLTLEAVFVSSAATALEDAPVDTATPQKVFINGQVYILRNGKTYTLTGVKVEDLP